MHRERFFRPLAPWLLLFVLQPCLAQDILHVNDQVDEVNFMPYDLVYFIDSTNSMSFADISRPSFSPRFCQHDSYQNKDFMRDASYWIRLPIRHTAESEKIWLLEFYDQTIDEIDAYIPGEDGTYRLKQMGDNRPFYDRTFKHKNFELLLSMERDTTVYYYFRVKSHSFADLRIAFRSINRFVFYALNEYFLFGTFYGMIIIISLYNLLIYLAIREIKNIYYIFYILSVAAYAMSLDGIGFQYLWPGKPHWNDFLIGISLYFVILWALIFTRRFLNTKSVAPRLDAILLYMIYARTAFFAGALLFFPELLTYRNIDIIPLSLIFYCAIHVLRQGYRPARFFVIAYGILFLGFFLRTLVYFNVLPFTTISHYSLHISFVLEMLFLTFALGDRIRILKDMRDRALRRIIHQHEVNMQLKDKVTKELEAKVKERTLALNEKNAQLEQINQKLERQAFEITQINSILDLDNWKLKNSLKEVLSERLTEKTMDFQQFTTLYPDKLSCYRFLETLKWEKGFVCRKCANEKYFEGSQKFARRCTKCGYNESITAFTIFHSIKFPIEKAFYITYLCVSHKKDFTLESLADLLDLRVNTIWAFKHKVADRVAALEISGGGFEPLNWEDVILLPKKASQPRSRKPILS